MCILAFTGISAQKNLQVRVDPKHNKPMLVGEAKLKHLKGKDFNEWYQKEYSDYVADKDIIPLIKPLMKGINIVIVMGTWCEDSRREVPRFWKILDLCGIKEKNVKLYCVDRDKKAGVTDISSMNVLYVPTFIFYKDGKELGRIVENPVEGLEKDMIKILSGTKP